ncbi:conserved oligomeric Golgi complex subunit 2, partial [Lecanoromycetidae sp. Uapishka_2]
SSLRGGDEKVEEVRLGLLGFRRELEGLRGKVDGRRAEVEALVCERKRIREQIQVGRRLLEVETKIGELEEKLMLGSAGTKKLEENEEEEHSSESDGESEEEGQGDGIAIPKLRRHMEQYTYIRHLVEKIGEQHPFLEKQEERILRLKQTVLLDLNSALKQALGGGEDAKGDLLKLLGIYKQMGQANEAMKILKESK